MLEAIRDSAKENPEDKLRLLLCFFLSMPDNAISKDDLAEYERALKETGVDMAPFEYAKKCVHSPRCGGCELMEWVRRLRDITRMSSLTASPAPPATSTPGGELFRGFSSISNRVRPSLPLSNPH